MDFPETVYYGYRNDAAPNMVLSCLFNLSTLEQMMKDLFFFDKFLVPKLITFFYWLILAGVWLGGLISLFTGGWKGVIAAVLTIIFGTVMARVWCELLIVLFKIQESVKNIEISKTGQNQGTPE